MFAEWDVDWKWLFGAVVGFALLLMRENAKLRKRVEQLAARDRIRTEPFPSDDTEEMAQINAGRDLARRRGEKLTWDEAIKMVMNTRAERERAKVAKKQSSDAKAGGQGADDGNQAGV